jgi:transposase-like protein
MIEFTEQGEIEKTMSKMPIHGKTVDAAGPDPEVEAHGTRRRNYTAAYKLRVLEESQALAGTGAGAVGAFLRKEGLYSSHLSQWRKQKAQGLLGTHRRGKAGKDRDALVKEVLQLKRRLAAAERRAAQAEFLVDLQKKISLLMGSAAEGETAES